ncbi:DUF4159 domain-containing protein [Symmachiella dynata]|uniref:DUF4159 domain-containing protein n=1 Tax=Symmachiella dynata TaxID=2527995 RepID=A0A517ZJT7_9PLAN|nr:DUF4159 domain-containing protein [Symmachiella dynata]QDU42738.1 hypothetical protein Mal52_12050 [Symmachiella dynata]|tara:strand:- start:904 stop:1647 length:744 start_codon:yes stop_codon:yes gene_type:complete
MMASKITPKRSVWFLGAILSALLGLGVAGYAQDESDVDENPKKSKSLPPAVLQPGIVNCANLTYGKRKTSTCFSDEFLKQIGRETHIRTNQRLVPVDLESTELFNYPVAVMTGEGSYSLTPSQQTNMRNYLENGGFIIASAGCSSPDWEKSFRRAVTEVFPEISLQTIDQSHPVFHTVYEIDELKCKGAHTSHLEGLEIDGKIVLIFSPDGLNDTGKVGGNCCCCGGNEIKNARQVNVNLLAYTLTH